jgi:hypothetical protein
MGRDLSIFQIGESQKRYGVHSNLGTNICATLERKLLPPDHPANNELAYNLKLKKLYYKSIGGITEGSATFFTTHNSALKLIGDHITLLNAKVHCITSQIALLREHKRTGYIMVDKI